MERGDEVKGDVVEKRGNVARTHTHTHLPQSHPLNNTELKPTEKENSKLGGDISTHHLTFTVQHHGLEVSGLPAQRHRHTRGITLVTLLSPIMFFYHN